MLEKRHRSDAGVPAPRLLAALFLRWLLAYAAPGCSDRDIIRPLAFAQLVVLFHAFSVCLRKTPNLLRTYMKIEIAFTQEEYAAILRAMEMAGFSNVADYLRHAVLQAVYNELSGR